MFSKQLIGNTIRFVKIYILITLYLSTSVIANNLSVGSVELVGQVVTNDFTFIQFDVSWENSWRNDLTGAGQSAPYNYDAIWVFVKYKIKGSIEWKHATINTSGYTAPSGCTINVPSDSMGAFIYRDGNGTGTFSLTDVKLRWNYGTNSVDDDDTVTIKVFAIEMVYIPQGSFYVGDGSNTNVAGHLHRADNTSVPFLISSENGFWLGGSSSANLGNNNAVGQYSFLLDDFNNTDSVQLSANYPKGYNDFYIMKYEITQGQYVDFLNCLTRTQQNNRTGTVFVIGDQNVINCYVMTDEFGSITMSARNSIRCDEIIPSSLPITFYCDYNDGTQGDGKDLACNYIHWLDGTAYADWAGLRPFTELELEKALRGSNQAPYSQTYVTDEYGWGNTSVHSVSYMNPPTYNDVINPGKPDEFPYNPSTSTNGNSVYSAGSSGPTVDKDWGSLRVGIFATSSSDRVIAGSSYYGVMELTGNVWEAIICLGRTEGRDFNSTHGDGVLFDNGDHNISDWPGFISPFEPYILRRVKGNGFRGGGTNWIPQYLRISDRTFANVNPDFRALEDGMRLVRTAP